MTTSIDVAALRTRFNQAGNQIARLQGIRATDEATHDKIVRDVAQAKARQGLHKEVVEVMGALQNRAHERSVGSFEALLTAITADILPGVGQIRLKTAFKANTTWLDVMLETPKGHLEDVYTGNGGALTNVVSLGLRYIALSRTKNRRLMVLDEPDCWLRYDRAPDMARVINQVSAQTNTQSLLIMHHYSEDFEGIMNVVELTADDTGAITGTLKHAPQRDWIDEDEPGLRCIELINLRTHRHTKLPCYPGATAYLGKNNLGKSTAISTALRAVAYGITDDTMITHEQDEFNIILHLERGLRLECSRHKKRNPAVSFRLYEKGNPTPVKDERAPTRNKVPSWVSELLGINTVDDMDIQLVPQKSPVFLLDESASRRAQILSVGRESSHLKTIMTRYEELRSHDNAIISQGELQVNRLRFRLNVLKGLDRCLELQAELAFDSDELFHALDQQASLVRLAAKFKALADEALRITKMLAILDKLPQAPTITDTAPMYKMGTKLAELVRRAGLGQLPSLPVLPTLEETADHLRVATTIKKRTAFAAAISLPALPSAPTLAEVTSLFEKGEALKKLTAQNSLLAKLQGLAVPAVPTLADTQPLTEMATTLQSRIKLIETGLVAEKQASLDYNKAQQVFDQLKHACGGVCPLCDSVFSSN